MTNVLSRIMSFIVILAALTSASASAGVNEDRAEVRAATQKVLSTLYQAQPSARRVVEGAAAHAVFSNFGMKIFFAGGGGGNGIAVSHKTKKEIFPHLFRHCYRCYDFIISRSNIASKYY